MKKVIATALAVTMLMANSISASAVTTGKWDFGAIRGSVSGAVQDIIKKQECLITYDFNGGSIRSYGSGYSVQTEHSCTAKGTHIVEDLNPTRLETYILEKSPQKMKKYPPQILVILRRIFTT